MGVISLELSNARVVQYRPNAGVAPQFGKLLQLLGEGLWVFTIVHLKIWILQFEGLTERVHSVPDIRDKKNRSGFSDPLIFSKFSGNHPLIHPIIFSPSGSPSLIFFAFRVQHPLMFLASQICIQQDPLKLSKSQKPTNLYSNPRVESNIYQFLLNIQG